MKLTVEVLLEKMGAQFTVLDSTIEENAPLLGRPLLYEEGCAVEAEGLYLSGETSLQLCCAGVCTIYYGGAVPAASGGSSIVVQESLGCVLNGVQAIFDRYQDWESSLEEILLTRGNIQALLQVSAPLLDNPLMVIRSDFSLVAQVGEEALSPEQRIFSPEADSLQRLTGRFLSTVPAEKKYLSRQFLPVPFDTARTGATSRF